MQKLRLSDATDTRILFGKEISALDKIYFVSDINRFDAEVCAHILSNLEAEKYELVIFAGNILPFLNRNSGAPLALTDSSSLIYDIFIEKKRKRRRTAPAQKERAVSAKISEYLMRANSESIEAYYSFVAGCRQMKIPIIYFTGNADYLLSESQTASLLASNKVPAIKEITDMTSIAKRQGNVYYPPGEFELLRLNSSLYILGANATESGEYPALRKLSELQNAVEEPQKIILVSHTPGTEKYRKSGSEDIMEFKRKFRFRFHLHGHCDKYYGVYIGASRIPTKSVHFEKL